MVKSKPKVVNDSLAAALASINKDFGEGSVMLLGENSHMKVDVIPTGIIPLDRASGIGGVPRGRIIEIYGPEASGKTTLAAHIVAAAQAMGGTCAFIDAEHSLDPVYAAALGVDTDALLISQPNHGEQALEILDRLVSTGELAVVVVDSVAALTPRAELEGEFTDANVGAQARMMSRGMRKLTSHVGQSNTLVVFINQLRQKIGVIYGSPETQPGGRALPFAASMRIDVRRIESIKVGDDVVGNRVKATFKKNKMASPFKVAEFDLIFGKGVGKIGALLDTAVELDVVQKSGAWLTWHGEQLGQGRQKAIAHVEENDHVRAEIEAAVDLALHPAETTEETA